MMKKKFNLTCSKVKSVCFNKNRHNWVVIGLFTGEVQIWDFRNGFQVVEFKENDQCIRSVDFHPMQSLVVSGGDDQKVRGWDFSENKKVFELSGHVDFIRTVQFHHELPWILSSSDDQTLRIWNWQSKTQISVITGHGHYIMCARFHPIKDLIVSGSLDSTLRIWDFSKLKSKFSSAHGTVYMLSNDVEPFIITEAHMKGVNWIDFHPTENIVATCSDDKLIKLWNFTSSNAFEDQVFHGHTHNVSCVAFSPDGKYLYSNGEDFTLRMWDLKGNLKAKFEITDQKQWTISVHSKLPLLAIGNDKSFNVISILPEIIIYQKKQKFVVYYSNKDGCVKLSDLVNHTSKSFQFGFKSNLESNRNYGRNICLNQFSSDQKIEGFIKIKQNFEDSYLRFFSIRLNDLFNYDKQLHCDSAVFTSVNNFVTLENGNLQYYHVKNFQMKKSINLNFEINNIYPAVRNHVLIHQNKKLILLNVQTEELVFTLEDDDLKTIKKISWNNNRSYFIIQNLSGLWIVDKHGKICVQKKVEYKIKSFVWDGIDCVLFNSHEHIRYLLINGEEGIIRTVDKILFLIDENQESITYLDLNEEFEQIEIDKSEIILKKAILHQQVDKVKQIIKEQEFLGKSMVSYLMKKKINLFTQQLISDKETLFYLQLHSEKLEDAFAIAKELQDNEKMKILADACTKVGKFSLAELCLSITKQNNKLLTHYFITGNNKQLQELQFPDLMSQFNQTFYTGDIKQRIKILAESGQVALAYSAAKIHGIQEFVEALENTFPDISQKVQINESAELLLPPQPIVKNTEDSQRILYSWPMKDIEEEKFDQNIQLVSGDENDDSQQEEEDNEELYKKALGGIKYNKTKQKQDNIDNIQEVKVDDKAKQAWGVEDNLSIELSDDEESQEDGEQIKTKIEKNSLLAWEHFVVGSLESGYNLLKSQVGLHNVNKMNDLVKQLTVDHNAMMGDNLPNPYEVSYFQRQYSDILTLASQAKLKECIKESQSLMQELMVAKATNTEEKDYLEDLRKKLLHYMIAFQGKLQNDEANEEQHKAELCVIMAMTTLEPAHALLILQIAINNLYKLKCYIYAAFVVRKFLKISEENPDHSKPEVVKKMNKVLKSCQQKGQNKITLNVVEDDFYLQEFYLKVDFEDLALMPSSTIVQCPYDQSSYQEHKKGQLCKCCDMCEIGFTGLGLKILNN